ncbi:MAG: ABC transporter permease [Candidatus Bathyarchaeia archaeon]
MSKHIRLLGFKYIRRQSLLTLTLIIAAASLLFSLTALSLLGFYRGFTTYLGEGEDIIVVYNPKSRTPYTSSVPAYLAERLASVNGVVAVSPEVIAPCLLKGQAIFLRGIILESFLKLNPLRIVEGDLLSQNHTSHVIVGWRAAEKLGLKVNDRVLFQGVLADRYVEAEVGGIFISNSIVDDEVLAPLHVGQWLRGMDYSSVTMIRLKIDRRVSPPSEVLRVISAEASQPSHPSPDQGQAATQEPVMPWAIKRFSMEEVGVEEAARFMKSYIDKYGVTREAILILSAAVFLFSSLTVLLASKTLISQHKGEINVLRSLGASKKLLKIDVLIKLLPWTIAASIIGVLAALAILTLIQGCGYLQVLSHTVPLQPDPHIIALSIVLSITLASIGILKSEVE